MREWGGRQFSHNYLYSIEAISNRPDSKTGNLKDCKNKRLSTNRLFSPDDIYRNASGQNREKPV
jgi:hypothetical protein